MKQIKETPNKAHWPRKRVKSIKCRKKDLIVRIADWSKDKDEPAFDVEVYIGGVYDWKESQTFTKFQYKTMEKAKVAACHFAQVKIATLL